MSDHSNYKVKRKNWGHIYHPCQEEIPGDMPEPSEKPVMTTTFLMQIYCMMTPIDWFSKRQNTIETAMYGSQFVAARTSVDQISNYD
eukprot:1707393-Ditylum_brightwellii.AAC.1